MSERENAPELQWLAIRPTPLELEWQQKYDAFAQELLTAFALPPELIGFTESNVAHAQHQKEAYRRCLRGEAPNG